MDQYKMMTFAIGFMVSEEEVKYAGAAFTRCTDSESKYGISAKPPPDNAPVQRASTGSTSSIGATSIPTSNLTLTKIPGV
jgi:hypothetical protein